MKRLLYIGAMISSAGFAQMPPESDITSTFRDGRMSMLYEAVPWMIGNTDISIVVPKGFVTDYASIPPKLHSLIQQRGPYSRAAIVHDYLYWTQRCTKRQADNLFMIAMKEMGVRKRDQWLLYEGVRTPFGDAVWAKNGRLRAAGEVRLLPARFHDLPKKYSWARARVVIRREKPPLSDGSFPKGAAYCTLGNSTEVPGGVS